MKYFFSYRVVGRWNELGQHKVYASSVNVFKDRVMYGSREPPPNNSHVGLLIDLDNSSGRVIDLSNSPGRLIEVDNYMHYSVAVLGFRTDVNTAKNEEKTERHKTVSLHIVDMLSLQAVWVTWRTENGSCRCGRGWRRERIYQHVVCLSPGTSFPRYPTASRNPSNHTPRDVISPVTMTTDNKQWCAGWSMQVQIIEKAQL